MVDFDGNFRPKIVGILNLTPDSFSDGGKFFDENSALIQIQKMLDEGADIIDIGAESTRPNAQILSAEEEILRLKNILPKITTLVKNFNQKNQRKILTGIDSYHFETIVFAHENGIDIVNDVSGLIDEKIIDFIATKKIPTILMHNLAIHANPDLVINKNLNINREIIDWAQKKIEFLRAKNVKKSQLIFDPGIGFSKDFAQSIQILKNIDSYRSLDLPIFIGHSKKSFLDNINIASQPNLDRAQKTLIISAYLARKKIDYLRVHDVKENLEFIGSHQGKKLII